MTMRFIMKKNIAVKNKLKIKLPTISDKIKSIILAPDKTETLVELELRYLFETIIVEDQKIEFFNALENGNGDKTSTFIQTLIKEFKMEEHDQTLSIANMVAAKAILTKGTFEDQKKYIQDQINSSCYSSISVGILSRLNYHSNKDIRLISEQLQIK